MECFPGWLEKELFSAGQHSRFTRLIQPGLVFDFDKTDIRPDAEAILMKVAGVIAASKSRAVIIFGYTDAKGSEEYNLQLSRRRADSVKAWLVAKGGISSEIIQTMGFGEAGAIALNTRPGWIR